MDMKYSMKTIRLLLLPVAAFIFVAANAPAFAQLAPLQIPFVEEWAASPHARFTEEPFIHWNEEGRVVKACARCHSTAGFLDYIGADGSTPWVVDEAPLIGGGIQCIACHNKVTAKLDQVTFPSGLNVKDLGSEARCMTCHQGRESTVSVNEKLAGLAADVVSEKIRFINIHYRAAGATRYGTQAKGGYEYDGKTYKGLYVHDKDATTCQDCHDTHTVEIKVEECKVCHRATEIKGKADLKKIRRTEADYDGDGDVEEGIAKEIESLHGQLLAAIQKYALDVNAKPVVYDSHAYPYFFHDTNVNGKPDPSEANYGNRYQAWTPRLLRAAYNYQFVAKDPGRYTHNPFYVIQLMHDSLNSLSAKVPVDLAGRARP